MPRGGARQGAGRKAGRSQSPEGKAIHKSVCLTPDKWQMIEAESETLGVTRSAVVARAIKKYFEVKE